MGSAWGSSGKGHRLGGPEAPAGLERVREGGDGNCLFHAIARQALGDTALCARARRELCDWMEEHLVPSAVASGRSALMEVHRGLIRQQREELCGGDDGEVLRYVQRMRREGEWGTGLEALAAAYRYGRPVLVWSPGGFSELRPPSAAVPGEPIRLLHNGRNHWDSARPAPGAAASSSAGRTGGTSAAEREDEEMAFALSLSLVETFPDVGEDERAMRRIMAAQAAEEREKRLVARGAGRPPEPRPAAAQPGPASPPGPHPKPAEGRGQQAEVVVIDSCPMEVEGQPAPAANDAGAAAGAAAPVAAPTGPWARRREARAAAAAASGAAGSADAVVPSVEHQERGPSPSAAAAGVHSGPHDAGAVGLAYASDDRASAALEECLAALRRVGLSGAEAVEALARCDGDVQRVKALWCIDWDESGRTVQLPFASPPG